MTDWPFDGLQRGHYGAILADPPWGFECWDAKEGKVASRVTPYLTMSMADIGRLPVSEIAREDCALFMWIVWPTMPEAVALIEKWGFKYKTCAFAWLKGDDTQPSFFVDEIPAQVGMGYWTRANSEVCLLATRGKPKRLAADVRQGIIAPRREHSRKPDGVHERIQRLVAGPYCELFARQKRAGWDVWGNQTDKFEAVA